MDKPHKRLDVWKLSMDLVTLAYRVTDAFPNEERYCLIDQIRRTAVSIPSNVAEGAARQTKKEFKNYLHIAQGSLSELDTQLELAKRLNFLQPAQWEHLDEILERVDKMLSGLIRFQKPLTPHA
jgi:four helix bundle protein